MISRHQELRSAANWALSSVQVSQNSEPDFKMHNAGSLSRGPLYKKQMVNGSSGWL